MGFLAALAPLAGSLLSGVLQNEATDKAADASVQANRESIEFQREALDRILGLQQPAIDAGNATRDLRLAGFGIAPTSGATGGNALANGKTNWDNYVTSYGDLNDYWTNNVDNVQSYFDSRGDYGVDHFNNYGRTEGRLTTGPATSVTNEPTPYAQPGSGITGGTPQELQDQNYQRFLDSGYAKSMLETTQADMDNMVGAFGAGGNALSGSAIGALNDRNRRNTNNAYIQFDNALAGFANAGQGASNMAAGAIQNNANMTGNALNNIGNTRMSSYLTQGQNNMGTFGKMAGTVGGWF